MKVCSYNQQLFFFLFQPSVMERRFSSDGNSSYDNQTSTGGLRLSDSANDNWEVRIENIECGCNLSSSGIPEKQLWDDHFPLSPPPCSVLHCSNSHAFTLLYTILLLEASQPAPHRAESEWVMSLCVCTTSFGVSLPSASHTTQVQSRTVCYRWKGIYQQGEPNQKKRSE